MTDPDTPQKDNRARGEQHHLSRLKEADVVEIRRMHSEEGYSMKKLAEIYGVCPNTILNMIHRLTWKHV